jgi:hypothetical protein
MNPATKDRPNAVLARRKQAGGRLVVGSVRSGDIPRRRPMQARRGAFHATVWASASTCHRPFISGRAYTKGSGTDVPMAELSLERRAEVRAANQKILEAAETTGLAVRLPLLCECGDPACKGFARMDTDAFNIVVTQPSWLISGDAHGARYAVIDADTGDEVLRAEG